MFGSSWRSWRGIAGEGSNVSLYIPLECLDLLLSRPCGTTNLQANTPHLKSSSGSPRKKTAASTTNG